MLRHIPVGCWVRACSIWDGWPARTRDESAPRSARALLDLSITQPALRYSSIPHPSPPPFLPPSLPLSQVGHKFGAPKGVAVLYVRPGLRLERLLCGGGQEGGRRAGTESVLLLAGLGRAAELVSRELPATATHMADLRDSLQCQLLAGLPPGVARINGPADDALRLPNTLSIGIAGIQAAALLAALSDQLAASAGAACHSGDGHGISAVLQAMRVPEAHAVGTLRLSVGRHSTQADVDRAAALVLEYVRQHGSSG